jgi:uncharacterized protein (DUF1501 family)
MLTFLGSEYRCCDRLSRRSFLQVGALGFGGLTLADLLRLQANGAAPTSLKSIIMVYLHGGPSHIDTFDMKPDAPAEVRGEFKPIATSLPGLDICEHLPLLAKIADKMTVIRNMSFSEYPDGHNPPLVYTGYPTRGMVRPTFGSVVSKLRGGAVRDMPPYVAFDSPWPAEFAADYLGAAHRPFIPGSGLGSLGPSEGMPLERLIERKELLRSFDGLRRDLDDAQGSVAALDAFQARALDMVLTPKARDAFDIQKEPDRVRHKYAGGNQFLQARRLVEAGVQVVTLTSHAELTTWGPAGPWDHHRNIFPGLRQELPLFDKRLYALLTDLHERGLDQDVAVVAWGEMGRTPKVNNIAGRDHWPDVGFALVMGGGLKMGQVIGATTRGGERAAGLAYRPRNLLATLYAKVLGIDLAATTLPGPNGRPMYLVDDGETIAKL